MTWGRNRATTIHELPALLQRPPAAPGAGRKKGSPNKLTADVKAAIMAAFDEVGGADYLKTVATTDPRTFCTLLGKILGRRSPEMPRLGPYALSSRGCRRSPVGRNPLAVRDARCRGRCPLVQEQQTRQRGLIRHAFWSVLDPERTRSRRATLCAYPITPRMAADLVVICQWAWLVALNPPQQGRWGGYEQARLAAAQGRVDRVERSRCAARRQ
jgi:hypothetical protein